MGRILRVLQIEDSPDDAELILRELRRAGYELVTLRVETSIAMVNALCNKAWDLVLSDYELPGFGGLEALGVLRASGSDIPFIVVSGAIGEEVAVAAMKAGAHDYVFKGNLTRLSPAIERELKEAEIRRQQYAAGNALLASEQRYRALFEHSPAPLWVEDLSEVKRIVDGLLGAGVKDFRTFFQSHPDEVERCFAAVRIVDVNERSVAFFGCQRKDDLLADRSAFFPESSRGYFREALSTLAEGGLAFDGDVPIRDLRGRDKVVSVHLSVSPGFEKTLGRVLVSFADITHRIELELSLREARANLERAQGLAHIGSWQRDLSLERPAWSPELFRIFGLDPSEGPPTYDRFTSLVHPADRALVLGTLEEVIASGKPRGMEYRINRADGAVRYVHELAEVAPGLTPHLRGTIQDITARKQAELDISESETRLRLAAEATGFGVYSWEFAAGECYYSPEFLQIFGLGPGQQLEIDDELVAKCLHPEDRALFLARMAAANDPAGDGLLETEYRIIRPDGEIRWVRVRGRTVFSGQWPLRANGFLQDITEQKLAEFALRAVKEELESFFRLIPDLACVASSEGYFTKVNPAWQAALGYTEEELLSRPYQEFIHPEDAEATLQEVARQFAGSGTTDFSNRYRAKDGSYHWLEWHVSPVADGQLFAAARDITERRQLEAVLKDMEKLSAKGQMAAYIAHEINNPLAGIKNAFTLLERAIPEDHPHRHYGDLIKREIDRIASIIRTMYHVYRPQTDTSAEVSLLEAFQDIQSLLIPKCRATGVSILLDLQERELTVHMNSGLLRQVLFNLVQNAVEASPAEGLVTLRATKLPAEILILVEDTGPGIPPELKDQIFQTGFTTKRDSGMSGLGLGLSACRNIVESTGGSLACQPNQSGQGTQFRVCLPDPRA